MKPLLFLALKPFELLGRGEIAAWKLLRGLGVAIASILTSSGLDRSDALMGLSLGLIAGGAYMEHPPAGMYVPGGLLFAWLLIGGLRAGVKRGQ